MKQFRSHKNTNLESVNRFVKWLELQKYAHSTTKRYGSIAKKLCVYSGNIALARATPIVIGDFLTTGLPSTWSDARIYDQLAALRCFFDFLYFGGMVDNVAPRFLRPRPRAKKLPQTLTQAQVKKLIKTAATPRDKALVEMLYATGCRTSEITKMRVESIDFRRRCVRVRAKRKERVVYFGASAALAIRRYVKRRKTGYLFQRIFPSQRGFITNNGIAWQGYWRDYSQDKPSGVAQKKYLGAYHVPRSTIYSRFKKLLVGADLGRPRLDEPLTVSSIGRMVKEIGKRAKLGDVRPKILRHSFATHMLERGADIAAIQELLGHTYVSSTQVYTHISSPQIIANYRCV